LKKKPINTESYKPPNAEQIESKNIVKNFIFSHKNFFCRSFVAKFRKTLGLLAYQNRKIFAVSAEHFYKKIFLALE
jgi:hypothetical protein